MIRRHGSDSPVAENTCLPGMKNDVFTTGRANLDDAGGIVLGVEVRVEYGAMEENGLSGRLKISD